MRYRRSLLVPLLVLTGALTTAGRQAPVAAPPDLDARVARAMKTFDVPGIGLAVVKDGTVAVAKGYGVRKLGDPLPVDARTLFGIASNTKVFTATSLGLLVEEGKLRWDARVVEYLPWFQLSDPYVTREITVRDLEHYQHDTFTARWRDRELRADAFVTFALNPDGGIDQAKMRAVSPETDFSFDFHDLLLEPVRQEPAR